MRLGGEPRGPPPRRFPEDGVEIVSGIRMSFAQIGGCAVSAIILGAVMSGFASVEITEYGLHYNLLTRKVSKQHYPSGRYFIGPFATFIKFPSVVKTIQFSDSKFQGDLGFDEQGDPMLRSRTRDGLDVSIELSFQYQLNGTDLYDLYTTMGAGLDFHRTYVRMSIDRLTEIATEYTANEFFVERTKIGKAMESSLKQDFEAKLYATIFSFQLRSVALPQDFESAIQMTEVKKQDVQVAQQEQKSTVVAWETKVMQAERAVKVRNKQADALAQAVMLENAADIEQFTATQEKAADSYSGVLKSLDEKEGDLLAYVQSRVVRDHPSDKITVGISMPSV
mmetsp:Transcript_130289/g.236808  ORF Transcript_130289/g.236808 Transcript_130289/m.236808 type:complete len:337 (+) Transcript_130289:135-1145(+)